MSIEQEIFIAIAFILLFAFSIILQLQINLIINSLRHPITGKRVENEHKCPESKEAIDDMQAQIDRFYFGSESHKKYLQGLLDKFKKPMSEGSMLVSAVLYGYTRHDIEAHGKKLVKRRDGYYFTCNVFGDIKLFEIEGDER